MRREVKELNTKLARTVAGLSVAVLCLTSSRLLCAADGTSPEPPWRGDVERLAAALLGSTEAEEDLRALTDEIGGRPTGSEANLRSVEWGLERFRAAGVEARREAFTLPARWLERSATARIISSDGTLGFSPRIAGMPYSVAASGLTAALLDGGRGLAADFARLGQKARGALVLIETEELHDVPGLFKEYGESAGIQERAFEAGVAGLVLMGSRPRDVLHRQNAWLGHRNRHPMVILERTAAQRALRLLRAGRALQMTVRLELDAGGTYESYNVVGEIPGRGQPEEIVVIGAHLDSWGLGTGALDNGCNVALVIDLARQIKRLGLRPRRTIRFVLFNGEEQGLHGSWGYVRRHAAELDRHVMASSYDIGSGRITGFFTGGRPDVLAAVERALQPVAGLGPFEHNDIPIVGTDNFDFMMEGIANLVANQESAAYGPNYHAGTDTFDKVDPRQMRLNAAIAAAVTYGFAEMDVSWKRHDRAAIDALVAGTDLESQMRTMSVWQDWLDGKRGRQP